MNKTCSSCELEKDLSDFGKRGDGFRGQCKDCLNKTAKKSRDKFSDSDKEAYQTKNFVNNIKRCYGLTSEQWNRMFMEQRGKCMYCGNPETAMLNGVVKRLSVDHDHTCCPETGKSCGKCIRGLSCAKCNYLVGTIEKNRERIDVINNVLINVKLY